jgi:ectoine hydroxylase-related dioxygenase (phytanoyl-CoA dioxygenase family)
MLMPITENNYAKNGYAIFKNVLSDADLARIEDAIFKPFEVLSRTLCSAELKQGASYSEKLACLTEIKKNNAKHYLNALKVSQNDPVILSMSAHVGIHKALKSLGQKYPVVSLKPYPIVLANDIFIPNGYNVRPEHQEWPVMQGSHNAVVVWFPLHDVAQDGSGIDIFPGSHQHGVLDYDVSLCGSRVKPEIVASFQDPHKIVLSKGDLVAFSAFAVHRSSGDTSQLRVALSIRFNDLESESFSGRGYPDNSTFSIQREPIDSLPHTFSPD